MTTTINMEETIETWELYPRMIEWHQHHRKFVTKDSENSPRVHINAMLIICSATMVEGALSSLLLFYLKEPYSPFRSSIQYHDPVSSFHKRNREELVTKVKNATWSKYPPLFSVITGKSLSDILVDDWERLTNLFHFRNLLAHGERITVKGTWTHGPDGLALGSLDRTQKKLFAYLEKSRLISKHAFGKTLGWSFLADEVADHFIEVARTSLTTLASATPDTDHENTFPKRLSKILKVTKGLPMSDQTLLYTKDNNIL